MKSKHRILAANVRRFREMQGLSKSALCRSIGMNRSYFDEIENGEVDPSLSTLERLAEALDVTVIALLGNVGNSPKAYRSKVRVGA